MATRDVTGRLFEANLETRSAQVRTPLGERVDVQFDPEHEPAIRELLGVRARFTGDVTFDRRAKRAKTVHVRHILTGVQLGLDFGGVDFWVDRPVLDLVREAGAGPVAEPADLELMSVSDADWAALSEALGLGD